ncbi:hypothetical protein SERLA73DRAFT_128285 [Serpula lacrymans var. lacrymans S7.3]|uniref:Heme haloperoxidase family profile domain-containing protein n=2 Tax=Serpula lacrymans var. lacrymans TaxID=341189 RepID=F8PEV7_SERL3|nr:uncharacterized protein SERLADRAFT_454360 [Serpula lacrymans var. lacrymans S7.9]EGO04168.1 hypothetical protein SERLA73DRAFT_128285 [Serpula lacrymans var. lacrymans S7.3]EGO30113.1 hypothetical protein SERLADRAFT_454360 [Serpula lacrymans var. lacrymans S7.9]
MSSPSSSSSTIPHEHSHHAGVCPVAGKTHAYCPRQPGDSRSPCPALNTLANHGYLPRNGRDIGFFDLVRSLKEGYHLSTFLACFLSIGGIGFLLQFRRLSLSDLARHNCIEHDASIVHPDVKNADDEYASTRVCEPLLDALVAEGRAMGGRITMEGVASIRFRREKICRPLDGVHSEIARGEMAIAIGVLGGKNADKEGLSVNVLHDWLQDERLPEGWKPDHTQGMMKTIHMTTQVRKRMAELKAQKDQPSLLQSEQTSTTLSLQSADEPSAKKDIPQ